MPMPIRWSAHAALAAPYTIEPSFFERVDWAVNQAWLGTTWQGTATEKQMIGWDFDDATAWAEKSRRPLYLGEFGAYSAADMDSRARWTEYVARQAEERGMSWAYWEFCAGFGVYDGAANRWNEPILRALVAGP